jgi:hypothetical protein
MKKGIQVLPAQRIVIEPIPGLTPGLPPLDGWTVQYVSGMEETSLIEPGQFLTKWQPDGIEFGSQPLLCIQHEDDAKMVCAALHEWEIEAKVIRYPVRQVA